MDASPPLTIPRLRLSRYSPQYKDQALTPVAGPSHNPDFLHADEDDEDAESTPRMSASAIPDRQSPRTIPSPSLPADNPAARLRALLARVPNSPSNATPLASASRPPALPSNSEPDSDLELPQSMTTASSIARESLKELFSHALREPGNTPRKVGRPRRNSIDTSEVEASPRVEEERARYKSRRRTLSDEEAEKSRHTLPSRRSFRSPAASAYDALRQRLNQSTSFIPPLAQEEMVMDMSMPPLNSSTDTAMGPVAQVDASSDTPPRATSTPMRTFQMSPHLNIHSNLLDQDSEMQNALQGMDSYESGPIPKHRHNTPSRDSTGPTPRPQSRAMSPARPMSWSSHSKSHSVNNLPPPPARRRSEDLDASSSRASSSLSGADYKERMNDMEHEQLHDRERGWNSPVPKLPKSPAHRGKHDLTHRHSWGSPSNGRGSPAHRLSRKNSAASLASTDDSRPPSRASPGHRLLRKDSTASLVSTDDGRPSSRASSIASRAEYREGVKEIEQERNKERERDWNRPQHTLSRSSSNLNLNKSERVRTISTPSRPESAASYLSPTARAPLQRHSSSNSLSSSRPSSPTSSISGMDIEVEIEQEFEHQRERNWNSPRPVWNNQLHQRGSFSPLSRSRPGSPTNTPPPKPTTTPRSRTNSVTHGNSLSVPSSVPRSKSPVGDRIPRPRSPHVSADRSTSPRSKSPVPPTLPPEKVDSSQNDFRSRFGWSFPQHKLSLPPLEFDKDSPQKSPPRPASRMSLSASASTPSHIPIRSPRKSGHASTLSVSNLSDKKKSHRRSVTQFTESIGAIPPRIEVTSDDLQDELPPVPIINGHDDLSSASEDESKIVASTPTAKPTPLPLPEDTMTPTSEPSANILNRSSSQAQNAQARPESPLVSPPLTPPAADAQPMFNLQTPPRRPQFQTPKVDFETPPPPRGMPDLPGPPSSEDEDQDDHTSLMHTREVQQGDLTAMKTPRPPGAWMATPAPPRQFIKEPMERPTDAESSTDSGLATPPSTLSRGQTLPLQTPAPPGGWVVTPAPPATAARRRGSILKVRFDLDNKTASEGLSADESSEFKDSMKGSQNGDGSTQSAPPSGDPPSSSSAAPESSVERPPPTPPSLRDRIRKKSPSIRVVDAYGREQVETEEPPVVEHETTPEPVEVLPVDARPIMSSPPRKETRPARVATPRSRSVVRVVDAMGREIEDEPILAVEDDSVMSTTPLSHNEALSRMRDTLSTMRQELSDAERSTDNTVFDKRMYVALQEQCKAALLARSEISKSLRSAQSAESELKSKYNAHLSIDNKVGNGNGAPLPIGHADVQLSRTLFSWRFLAGFLLIQLLLLGVMYRYSLTQARKIFLSTYYDPFYPELYIYLLKPDTTHPSIPSCPSWSIFSVFANFQRDGWKGVFADAWTSASCTVYSYFQSTWSGWHYTQDKVTHAWPPT